MRAELFLNEAIFRQLFWLCKPWLELPLWASETFYDCRNVVNLAGVQLLAQVRNPFDAGRPRDAATCGDMLLDAWKRLRAIQHGHDPTCEASSSTSVRSFRHALWAITQAIHNANVVALPTDNELQSLYNHLPADFKAATYGIKLWGAIDGTLIRLMPSMLSRVHLRSQFYAVKRDSTGRGSVVFADNAFAHLLVVDAFGRIRFMDVCRPGSVHDVRQLRMSNLSLGLAQFPTSIHGAPIFKLAADDGFRGIRRGLDAHFQLRRDAPAGCQDRDRFARAIEFYRASVEHVNHDFKAFAPACVNPRTKMPLRNFAAVCEASLLVYAFYRYDNPLHRDRWLQW
jgi:hypothetical protein